MKLKRAGLLDRQWRKTRGVVDAGIRVFGNLARHHLLGSHRLSPLYAVWHVTHRCNLACAFCDDGTGKKYPKLADQELKTHDALELLEKIRSSCGSVYFTGGEPFVRQDFPLLLNRARQLGFWPILANTNLSHANISETAIRNLDVLIVSLGSTDEARYDKILQSSPGKTKIILENLRRCAGWQRDHGPKVVVNCVICADRVQDARGVFRFCQEQGLWFSPVPENKALHLDQKLLVHPDYCNLVEEILTAKRNKQKIYGSYQGLSTLLRGQPFSCYPTLALYLFPNGDLLAPCRPLCSRPLNLLENDSLNKAMQQSARRFSWLHRCNNRCHLPCYVHNSRWMSHPLEMAVENFRVATSRS